MSVRCVVGERGSGRTTHIADLASGWPGPVVTVPIDPTAGDLPWFGVTAVIDALARWRTRIEGPVADALARLEGTGAGHADARMLRLGLLALVRDALADGALVALDDADHADIETRHALAHLLQALAGEPGPGLLVLTMTTGTDCPAPPGHDGIRVELPTLSQAEAEALAVASAGAAGRRLTAEQVSAIAEWSHGNPGAIVDWAEHGFGTDVDGQPHAGPDTIRRFRRSLDPLPERTQRALAIAALSPQPECISVEMALRAVGLDVGDLNPAIPAGVVGYDDELIVFRHPLLRLVARMSLDGPDRAAARRALVDHHPDPVVAAFQRSVLAPVPSDRDAAAIAGCPAPRPDVAAELLERAALLRSCRTARARDRLGALRCWVEAGRVERARRLVPSVLHADLDPVARTELDRLALACRAVERTVDDAVATAEACAAAAPSAAALLLGQAAVVDASDGRPVSDLADRALALVEGDDQRDAADVRSFVASAAVIEAVRQRRLDDARRHMAGVDVASLRLGTGVVVDRLAPALIQAERYTEARQMLDAVRSRARGSGAVALEARANSRLALIAYREGDIGGALALTEAVTERPAAHVDRRALVSALLTEGICRAWHGDEDGCRRAVARAEVHHPGGPWPERSVVLGFLALQTGDHAGCIAELEPLRARVGGAADGSGMVWMVDLGEAYLRSGRTEEARQVAAELLDVGAGEGRQRHRLTGLRLLGLVADDYDPLFEEACALADDLGLPGSLARTRQAWAERLRGDRRYGDARERLLEVRSWYASRDVVAMVERIDGELARLPGRRRGSGGPTELTDQERAVAALAAGGRANREIAAQLFVSVRTVEKYLASSYRKLGVRNRAELASRATELDLHAELAR